MDVVGSEIGQKMRSAIKAKLTELGCYVDDELPDYVMVMVANKRTRAQMEDDLQLFLGDNTELFVNWLHQVLKKLQEVTIAAPLKPPEQEKSKERSKSKEKKAKEKKSKKSDVAKKAKKKEKDKEKSLKKKQKEAKKLHKSKKKSKQDKHEIMRPNIPPLLMNMEKESEPSITDVFAGQILKNHGVIIDTPKIDVPEQKITPTEVKRTVQPIIDPATIMSELETSEPPPPTTKPAPPGVEREDQIKEINEIEAKIQGLKQKLAEQLDSMSEDEDFLNIRTEAEELMNDFAEDVFQETCPPQVVTPPIPPTKPTQQIPAPEQPPKVAIEPEELPQIELRLPKRPVRDRLGAKPAEKEIEKPTRDTSSMERYTPEKELECRPQSKSAKSRLGDAAETKRRVSICEDEPAPKKMTSRVSVLESRAARVSCASVVRVRPRPRVAPSSSLLLKAMADAHKSLFNRSSKQEMEPSKVQRALVLPMRRVDAKNIVIQVPAEPDTISLDDDDKLSKSTSEDLDPPSKEEYIPAPITKKITNTEYVPSGRRARVSRRDDDNIVVETINIHNPSVAKDKDTQFIVTMDGFNPNAFLAKKLMTEGLLDEDEILDKPTAKTDSVLKINENKETEKPTKEDTSPKETVETNPIQKKRLSNTSDESDTQVIINNEQTKVTRDEKHKQDDKERDDRKLDKRKITDEANEGTVKKRKASPIVFNVKKEQKEIDRGVRERTESAGSDSHVIVTTAVNTKKYDSLPPLDKAAATATTTRAWCRAFPQCRFGPACVFLHPRCKFSASCTRRGCAYSHQPAPSVAVASHVVPSATFKSITPSTLPSICKFFPNCVNPACHFYHPKPCRYGKACLNKIECNFYHSDAPTYKYPV